MIAGAHNMGVCTIQLRSALFLVSIALVLIGVGSYGCYFYADGTHDTITNYDCVYWHSGPTLKRDIFNAPNTLYSVCHTRSNSYKFFPNSPCNATVECVCDNIYCLAKPPSDKQNTGLILSVVVLIVGIGILVLSTYSFCFANNSPLKFELL